MINIDKIYTNMQNIVANRNYKETGEGYALTHDSLIMWQTILEILNEYRGRNIETDTIKMFSTINSKFYYTNSKYDHYLEEQKALGYDIYTKRMDHTKMFSEKDSETREETVEEILKDLFTIVEKCNNNDNNGITEIAEKINSATDELIVLDKKYIEAVKEKHKIKEQVRKEMEWNKNNKEINVPVFTSSETTRKKIKKLREEPTKKRKIFKRTIAGVLLATGIVGANLIASRNDKVEQQLPNTISTNQLETQPVTQPNIDTSREDSIIINHIERETPSETALNYIKNEDTKFKTIIGNCEEDLINNLARTICEVSEDRKINVAELIGEINHSQGTSEYNRELVSKMMTYLNENCNGETLSKTRVAHPMVYYIQAMAETYIKHEFVHNRSKTVQGYDNPASAEDISFYYKLNETGDVTKFEVRCDATEETEILGRWFADGTSVGNKIKIPNEFRKLIVGCIELDNSIDKVSPFDGENIYFFKRVANTMAALENCIETDPYKKIEYERDK